jgi:hypothetical protein
LAIFKSPPNDPKANAIARASGRARAIGVPAACAQAGVVFVERVQRALAIIHGLPLTIPEL